jgi:hypothetical protein
MSCGLLLLMRGDRSKELEILTLRHQVAVRHRQVHRPYLGDGDRVLLAAVSRLRDRSCLPGVTCRCQPRVDDGVHRHP